MGPLIVIFIAPVTILTFAVLLELLVGRATR